MTPPLFSFLRCRVAVVFRLLAGYQLGTLPASALDIVPQWGAYFDNGAHADKAAAIEFAIGRWELWLADAPAGEAGTLELFINFTSILPSGDGPAPLAQAGSVKHVYQDVALSAAQYLVATGSDPQGQDGQITFNTDYEWHSHTTSRPSATAYDLASVTLHEIGHQLGMFATYQPGSLFPPTPSSWGHSGQYLSRWDSLLRDEDGDAPEPFFSPIPGDSFNETAPVNFVGQQTMAAFGPIPVYAPVDFEPGSSLSHIDLPGLMYPSRGAGDLQHGLPTRL